MVGKDKDNVKEYFIKEDEKPAYNYYKTNTLDNKADRDDNLGKIKYVKI